MQPLIVGAILLIIGGLNVVRPDIMLRFQVWTQRVVMGANYEPGERTYRITRVIGALIMLMGFFIVTGFIR